MDKFGALICRAAVAWAVVRDPLSRTFEVVQMADFTDAVLARLIAQRSEFVGVVGLVDGVPQTCLDVSLEAEEIQAATELVMRHIVAEVYARVTVKPELAERAESAAFAAFMQHLTSLPDTRTEV